MREGHPGDDGGGEPAARAAERGVAVGRDAAVERRQVQAAEGQAVVGAVAAERGADQAAEMGGAAAVLVHAGGDVEDVGDHRSSRHSIHLPMRAAR